MTAPMITDRNIVVECWKSIPHVERLAIKQFQALFGSLGGYVPVVLLTLNFAFLDPVDAEYRQSVFELHYQIKRDTIEVEGVQIDYAYVDAEWWAGYQDSVNAGGCRLGEPEDHFFADERWR